MWQKDDWIKAYAMKARLADIALAELYKYDQIKAKEIFQDYITQILNNKEGFSYGQINVRNQLM